LAVACDGRSEQEQEDVRLASRTSGRRLEKMEVVCESHHTETCSIPSNHHSSMQGRFGRENSCMRAGRVAHSAECSHWRLPSDCAREPIYASGECPIFGVWGVEDRGLRETVFLSERCCVSVSVYSVSSAIDYGVRCDLPQRPALNLYMCRLLTELFQSPAARLACPRGRGSKA
jgi:hypothetical protein